MAKKRMAKAFENSKHGEFKAKAEKAGESTREFAEEKAHAPGKLGKQARLAEAGMNANHKKSHLREKMYGKKEKD